MPRGKVCQAARVPLGGNLLASPFQREDPSVVEPNKSVQGPHGDLLVPHGVQGQALALGVAHGHAARRLEVDEDVAARSIAVATVRLTDV